MSKHTPGDWLYEFVKCMGYVISTSDQNPGEGEHVACNIVNEADARLIVAAPKMWNYILACAEVKCGVSGMLPAGRSSCGHCPPCEARALLAEIEEGPHAPPPA